MTGRPDPARSAMEARRDHALRDLEELAQQVENGEIDVETAETLEAGYRAELEKAEAALAEMPAPKEAPKPKGRGGKPAAKPSGKASPSKPKTQEDEEDSAPPRFPVKGLIGMGAAVVVLSVLIGVIVVVGGDGEEGMPDSAMPPATQGQSGVPADPDDPLAQMEATVAANPEVNGMRLALAGTYFERGDYIPAMEHYLAVLENNPTMQEEAISLARVGWMAYVTGQPETARDYLHAATQLDPAYGEAQLFYGVVLLYGVGDAEAALPVLEGVLQLEDLPETLRPEVENMIADARAGGFEE